MSSAYVIDSSALIDLTRTYPSSTFEQLWTNIGGLVGSSRLLALMESAEFITITLGSCSDIVKPRISSIGILA